MRMILQSRVLISAGLLTLVFAGARNPASAAAPGLKLEKGDHICYIGNTLADRMQHHGWLETYLHAAYPKHELVFRNLGFSGDMIKQRTRSSNFGSQDQWLSKEKADVVFCFFGYGEALGGPGGVGGFEKDLGGLIDSLRDKKYNGKSAPRLVVFSPIAHEDLKSHVLPDGSENNRNLALYTEATERACKAKKVAYVDLFSPSQKLYAAAKTPLTMNGIHLLDHGNKAIAGVIVEALLGKAAKSDSDTEKLRAAVLDKNLHWFSRYRVVDGYNVFGGRSKLSWHGQSNADVMRREMEIFDIMTANRDKGAWNVAQGGKANVKDNNFPDLLKVKTNRPGKAKGGAYKFLSGKEAASKMKVAEGMELNLFASEEKFPRLINPVQMAVDTDSRLWVSVWPSYPHWNPTNTPRDALVILPDENGDGKADKLIVFADKLNSITGFEFWGGGVLVAAPPEIWHLKDTDGDDKADVKIRMLQGVSSADTHHTANGLVIGPAGALYWSRGIFNQCSNETPTRVFRSGASGVYRFDPRTFEVGFHFPIGPNPHGDVFDSWGFQFVNDGTGGTGSYANLGKGIGNKKWFRKRVRPVAATGILSSSHFPERNNENFLICNTIGFLGVLQHQVKYDGADITAVEIEPILVTTDQNFRPTDCEIGGDGALYVSDWSNPLIGHMQHNMRDPNRDHAHGRVYRVTYKGRPLVKPAKMKGQPIEKVCDNFFAREKSTRYRARLELSGRKPDEISAKVGAYAAALSPAKASKDRNEAQALLECLWVFEEQRLPNLELLKKVFKAEEPRVRAAAIRTLGHWAGKIKGWEDTLVAGARDSSALVRAEAVKAAVELKGLAAAEVIFEVATRPTDAELNTVLGYARKNIDVDKVVQDAVSSGKKLSLAAEAYVLRNASVADLLKLDPTEGVYRAILSRAKVKLSDLDNALTGLAKMVKKNKVEVLMGLIKGAQEGATAGLSGLGKLLASQPAKDLAAVLGELKALAAGAKTSEVRQLCYSALIAAAGAGDEVYRLASASKDGLRDFLAAVPNVGDKKVRAGLYSKVRSLVSKLPANLKAAPGGSDVRKSGIHVDFFAPHSGPVDLKTLAKMKPKAGGVVPEISLKVPQRKANDAFALRFTGNIQIPRSGNYTFSINSDDGSRLYIDGKEVINNDGSHGMREKSKKLRLSAGSHPFIVTYYDGGGSDGLVVSWSGPGFKKKRIAASRLTVSGGENLHDLAIRTLGKIPGNEKEKFSALAALLRAGKNRDSSISVLQTIPSKHWDKAQVRPLVDSLVSYLGKLPAADRKSDSAVAAFFLAVSLTEGLPAAEAKAIQAKLRNLDAK
ncbi:MAG: PA14 domain-containing protein [Planctomycetes bacterium]|nr:PA14 domain-containing protein [Planctomycetota bacterium]